MRARPLFLGLCLFALSARGGEADLVDLKSLDFSIRQDLVYASADNPLRRKLYHEAKCVLRRKLAEALARAQSSLKLQSLSLQVRECYRPVSLHEKLWDGLADKRLAEGPREGGMHSRGTAVDLTLVDTLGGSVTMKGAYGELSVPYRPREERERIARNYRRLTQALEKEGMRARGPGWWHFELRGGENFPLENTPLSAIK